MIISHQHRYLFVELPRTGSTAIARELMKNYGGRKILYKHSTFQDFLRKATPEEKKYFVFSCIRNPLDEAVSRFFKLKTDHRGQFTNPEVIQRRWSIVSRLDRSISRFLRRTDADFPTFFKKCYRVTYNSWAHLSHKEFDCLLRFENLIADFDQALRRIGIEPIRPLPVLNQTNGRARDFASYYTPEIIPRAKKVFGPFLKEWGYQFPPHWGDAPLSWWNLFEFQFLNLFRVLYWRHLRFRI